MMRIFLGLILILLCGLGQSGLAQDKSEQILTILPNTQHIVCGKDSLFIDAINISGNKHTKTSIIYRELSCQTGLVICRDSLPSILHLNYQRLYNLNIFTDIKIRPRFVDSFNVIIDITVKEQWFIIPQADIQLADRNINVWWYEQNHALDRVNLGLYLQHKNLTGSLDNLSLNIHAGYTQQLTIAYALPYIDKKQKQGIGFSANISRSRELAYTTDSNKLLFARDDKNFITQQFDITATYVYRPAYRSRHYVQLGYHYYSVADTLRKLNSDYFANNSLHLKMLELGYRYELNRVDNWNYPRRGLKLIASAAGRFGIEGMDFQTIAGLELGLFKQIKDRWFAAFVFRGRTTLTDQQPYYLQAAMGYKMNYVRGYEYYVVDAYHFGIARLDLKYELVRWQYHKLPFRYLPELPLWIYPKVFIDAGYAANPDNSRNSFLANRLLFSYGVGVDIITAYDLKLRIEFAVNHLHQNGLYLHANSE
jgi:outer membrane protein assembly factor BamA